MTQDYEQKVETFAYDTILFTMKEAIERRLKEGWRVQFIIPQAVSGNFTHLGGHTVIYMRSFDNDDD